MAISRVLGAVVGIVSVPLLLKHFGIENYGVLSLATACNGYLRLLDLGINTGSIKYFSQWRAEGKHGLVDRVARTSITFYAIIGGVNTVFLISIAVFGEGLFNISIEQFLLLRKLLLVLAVFSVANWISMVFSQLLISDDRISFTQQVYASQMLIKLMIIVYTICSDTSLGFYFFLISINLALVGLPYYWLCRKRQLISSFLPMFKWKEFGTVFKYSMAIFALGFFQMTASSSRPIILGMFANDAVKVATEYRIIEVFSIFIISIGGMLTSVFLPRSSNIVASRDVGRKEAFAYKGTVMTTILTMVLCMSVALCAEELLGVYVGPGYGHLVFWLRVWCFTLLINLPTTPCNSLILAIGKTRVIVLITMFACCFSVVVNIAFAPRFGVGSALVSYFIYVLIVICFNYFYYYPKTLLLKRWSLILSFFKPALLGIVSFSVIDLFSFKAISIFQGVKLNLVAQGGAKVLFFVALYLLLLLLFKVIDVAWVKARFVTANDR